MTDMAESWGADAQSGGERGGWFRDAKYAMFVHWGVYSVLEGRWHGKTHYGNAEWIMNRAQIPVADYEPVAKQFNPVKFDAHEWVALAKAAGMRYIVITSKHHDGFAMFKSEAGAFNIVDATPFGRDPLKELADACAEGGIKLGFYYSQFQDWHEPDAAGNTWEFDGSGDFDRYLRTKAMPQIRELLTNYGPVALIWFDTPGSISPEASEELTNLVHELQPDCLVNSRVGNGFGDYSSKGDGEVPLTVQDGLWESIDTHNDSWGFARDDVNWKSPHEIMSRLVRIVAKGGTYMLNVGPTGEGDISPTAAAMLRDAGRWVHAHGEAIYGTRPWADQSFPWGEIVTSGGKLFLHVLHMPPDRVLHLPGVEGDVPEAVMVGEGDAAGAPADCERVDGILQVSLPEAADNALIPVVALTIENASIVDAPAMVIDHTPCALEAPFADRTGCELRKRRWMEKFGEWQYAETIAGFSSTADRATWRIQTPGFDAMYLAVDYAASAEADGSEFDIHVGDQVARFLAIDTGDRLEGDWTKKRARFRRRRVGIVTLSNPGTYDVAIVPTNDDVSGDVCIERVVFLPVK